MKISSRMFNALLGGLLLVFVLVGQAGAQTWTQLSPGGGPPVPRAFPAGTYDEATNRMIVFGGATGDFNYVPTMLNDTWVLSNANGLGGAPTWTQLSPTGGPPSARDWQSAVYDPANNLLTVFGGNLAEAFCGQEANDTWVLSNANGLGGAPTWTQLSPTGGLPSARGGHSAVYDPTSNRMIMFGGTGSCSAQNNEVWVLEHSNGLGGTPNWIQLSPSGTQPALAFHKAVYDSMTNRMIIFGGSVPSAVSVLSNANGLGGTPTWTQLTPGGAVIPARAVHSAAYDPATNKMIVFAGCCSGTPSPFLNDTWVLSNANGLGGAPTWTQLSPTGGPPGPRQAHAAVFSVATNRMTVYGGGGCCPGFPFNDVWVLTDANGTVLFAAFAPKVEITLGPLANDDEFEVKATLTLGTSTDGINPVTEAVIIQVGSYSATIPAGSFKFKPATLKKPAQFTFEGIIDGVKLEAKITPLGANSFDLKAEGNGVNLTGTVNPVTVGLTIGNDQGSAAVTAKFE